MAGRPVLMTIDDDPSVSRAVARDLRRRYGEEFRVLRAESGRDALDALREIKLRGERAAVLLADHRMPEMDGVAFLERAIEIFPLAKRVLLTAYADTDAAIRAINVVDLDHYLLKPWDPPEDKLYPVVDDMLEQWRAVDRPPFEGVRVVGHRWSARSHQVRDFLARNQIPYRWLDATEDSEARRLLDAAGAGAPDTLPLVLTEDGQSLTAPSNRDLAAAIGLSTTAELPFYDLVVVGGGPAGLGAAVYGASEGLRTLLVEREAAGGRPGRAHGSRTTWASPPACPARTSPAGRARRPAASAPSCSRRARSPGSPPVARPGCSPSTTAPSSPRTRSSSPPASRTTGCRHLAWTS